MEERAVGAWRTRVRDGHDLRWDGWLARGPRVSEERAVSEGGWWDRLLVVRDEG